MSTPADIWAVVPVKELDGAKQRLAGLLSPAQRRALIEVMVGEGRLGNWFTVNKC